MPPEPHHRTAVFGVAVNYPYVTHALFVVPLRMHFGGDIFILTILDTLPLEVVELYAEQRVIARNMACLKDCTGASLVVKRFVQIADLCGAYEMCLSVDLRDVLFQADPFPMVLPPNPVHDLVLHCEDDRVPLGASHFNRIWMGLCYGGRFMNEVSRRCVINSGVVFGTSRAFNFLAEQLPTNCTHRKFEESGGTFHGKDQTTLNWLYYSGRFRNQSAPSAILHSPTASNNYTVHAAANMRYDPDWQRNGRRRWRLDYSWPDRMPFVQYNYDMRTPIPVLHQYDVDEWIRDFLTLWLTSVQSRARGHAEITGRWDQKIDALNETAVLTELFALIALEAPLTGRILPHDAHHAGKASIPKACEMYVRRWSELHVQRANATNPLKTKALQPSGADLRSVRNSLVEKFCYQHSCKRAQPGEPRSAMICAAR